MTNKHNKNSNLEKGLRGFEHMNIKHNEYKYEMLEDYSTFLLFSPISEIQDKYYHFYQSGLLTIKKGYRWDGASGPTIDTKSTIRASCVHDVLYQMIRMNQLSRNRKLNADLELKRYMLADSQSEKGFIGWFNRARANYYYAAVHIFGSLTIDDPIELDKDGWGGE